MDDFPPKLLSAIRNKYNLPELVGKRVELRQLPGDFIGCCPFHQDDRPSFRVNKWRYRCFGCGVNGDVIEWYRSIHNTTFPDAVRALSKGIDWRALPSLPENPIKYCSEYDAEAVWRTIEINGRLWQVYRDYLRSHNGANARSYAELRNIYESVGYAPGPEYGLAEQMLREFCQKDLLDSGSFAMSTRGQFYARLRCRLVIPLRNKSGYILGFTGRSIPGLTAPDTPKYLDPPTTKAFCKKRYLFGLDRIGPFRKVVLVEGQIDCLAMTAKGHACLATNTCHITSEQTAILCDTVDAVDILYDGDTAGIEGAMYTHNRLLGVNVKSRIWIIPDGKDPADGFSKPYEFLPSVPQIVGDFMTKRYNMSRLQELAKPWVEDNIKQGYAHFNVVDYCMQAYPQYSQEIKDAVITMKHSCKEVDGALTPQDEDIKRLIKAWMKPCREVRLKHGQTKQRQGGTR